MQFQGSNPVSQTCRHVTQTWGIFLSPKFVLFSSNHPTTYYPWIQASFSCHNSITAHPLLKTRISTIKHKTCMCDALGSISGTSQTNTYTNKSEVLQCKLWGLLAFARWYFPFEEPHMHINLFSYIHGLLSCFSESAGTKSEQATGSLVSPPAARGGRFPTIHILAPFNQSNWGLEIWVKDSWVEGQQLAPLTVIEHLWVLFGWARPTDYFADQVHKLLPCYTSNISTLIILEVPSSSLISLFYDAS